MIIIRSAALALIAFLLTGCFTSPPAPAEHYYRLVAEPAGGRLPLRLRVQRFAADGLLRERALLYSDDSGHRVLKQHSYHYWADAPSRVLTDYLAAQLNGGSGGQVSDSDSDSALPALHGSIKRMERLLRDDGVKVALSLELRVRSQASNADVLHRRYDIIEPAASDRIVDSVKAFEAAVQKITAQLAADVAVLSDAGWRSKLR